MSKSAILCVDDETVVLESLELELRRAFDNVYLYEFAESAEEALELLQELIEDGIEIIVIISDWLMPGMKGDQFLIVIHREYPNIITIMLTGQANKEAIERAITQANLYAYLPKPWNNKKLIETIKSGIAQNE
ncbi:response regulator [Nostoc sp. FACHB-133]|uniref:response regulator n=1 Tax=Nostoc sp. FACHB-133 TaxID=2692835 RepID=UPI00168834AC|nr:response regulator [Nostoc sp. FACHB-133]MBD2527608.1 response regulator [Nostoc sp. FACHB-133]